MAKTAVTTVVGAMVLIAMTGITLQNRSKRGSGTVTDPELYANHHPKNMNFGSLTELNLTMDRPLVFNNFNPENWLSIQEKNLNRIDYEKRDKVKEVKKIKILIKFSYCLSL